MTIVFKMTWTRPYCESSESFPPIKPKPIIITIVYYAIWQQTRMQNTNCKAYKFSKNN